MKANIRYPPWTPTITSLVLVVLLSIVDAPVAFPADFDCVKNPTHHKCDGGGDGGNEGDFVLEIHYDFDNAHSTVVAVGTKHCDEQGRCSFNGDVIGDGDGNDDPVLFNLPDSLLDVIGSTRWKGMEEGTFLDPDKCFGETDPSANAFGRGVELSYDFVNETWFAAIGSYALDTDADVDRKYVFYFLCDYAPCANSDWGEEFSFSMLGDYEGAELLRIESPPKLDNKLKSTPCRCTISNIPNCPGEASVPMRIQVLSETQLQ